MVEEGTGSKYLGSSVEKTRSHRGMDGLTGRAVDSKWPQSSTRPVILPTASRERR